VGFLTGLADFSEGDLSSSLWWLQGLALRFGLVALLYLACAIRAGRGSQFMSQRVLTIDDSRVPVWFVGLNVRHLDQRMSH
jgi:hypothetical protein